MTTHYYNASSVTPLRSELKKSHGDLTATRMYTTERQTDVQEAVEQDFKLHYRVTDTSQFLDKLLPVEQSIVDKILQSTEVKGLYDSQNKRWTEFPKPGTKYKESSIYGPFNRIAEAIRLAAENSRKGTTSEVGPTTWADYHTRSPTTQDSRAAHLRPDVLFALKLVADHAKSSAFQEEQAENPNFLQMIWWLQIVAAVEVKRSDSNWNELITQLIGYLRRILREQLDRRFVFGLTLGLATMTVWMHDRSGVIGTKTSIDIHKEPAKFVQIIAAFSLLPPEKLGFDPTIKLLVSADQAVPSYKPTPQFLKEYGAAPYNRRWVIKMNSGKEYVTVRTVSFVQAGFMRGRGPIVWVVVPYGQRDQGSKFLVLKQSWQPRDVENEGKLYEIANGSECDNVGRVELWEDVLVSGEPDTTDRLIRQGLDDSTGPGKRAPHQRPGSSDPYIHVVCTGLHDIQEVRARETGSPVSRVRTRVVLSTYGWLIKYFSTLRELLQVLRDAIKGHKHLYYNGVLHRDISPGNILIEWLPGSKGDEPHNSGRLIDLDRGKKGKLAVGQVEPLDRDKMVNIVHNMIHSAEIAVEKDVSQRALEFFPLKNHKPGSVTAYIIGAVEHALQFRHLTQEQTCTTHNLGWKQVTVEKLYNFDFHPGQRQKGSRTGTPPYTSGEILESQRYFHGHPRVFHDAVHDLESFFWVLVHICLTRNGPGGVRRDELKEENEEKEEYIPLRRVVFCFFDSSEENMRANKRQLFSNPDHLGEFVLVNFHDYFHSLKGLVKEWFHVLLLAHQFHAYEYHNIHDMVLDILDKALAFMPADIIDDAGQMVLDKRKADIEQLYGNPFGKVQNSPHPHVSPTSQRQMSVPYSPPSSPTPVPSAAKKARTLLGQKDRLPDYNLLLQVDSDAEIRDESLLDASISPSP